MTVVICITVMRNVMSTALRANMVPYPLNPLNLLVVTGLQAL